MRACASLTPPLPTGLVHGMNCLLYFVAGSLDQCSRELKGDLEKGSFFVSFVCFAKPIAAVVIHLLYILKSTCSSQCWLQSQLSE